MKDSPTANGRAGNCDKCGGVLTTFERGSKYCANCEEEMEQRSSNGRATGQDVRNALEWIARNSKLTDMATWDRVANTILSATYQLDAMRADEPSACIHPWERVGINADGKPFCVECLATLTTEPPWPDSTAEPPAGALGVAPIAKVTVREGLVQRCGLYAPGLPDGDHDLFPVPLNPNGHLAPSMFAEPPTVPAKFKVGDSVRLGHRSDAYEVLRVEPRYAIGAGGHFLCTVSEHELIAAETKSGPESEDASNVDG